MNRTEILETMMFLDGWEKCPGGKKWKSPHARAYFTWRKPYGDGYHLHRKEVHDCLDDKEPSVRRMIRELPAEKHIRFIRELHDVVDKSLVEGASLEHCDPIEISYHLLCATVEQLVEAYLRTFDKWEEKPCT